MFCHLVEKTFKLHVKGKNTFFIQLLTVMKHVVVTSVGKGTASPLCPICPHLSPISANTEDRISKIAGIQLSMVSLGLQMERCAPIAKRYYFLELTGIKAFLTTIVKETVVVVVNCFYHT